MTVDLLILVGAGCQIAGLVQLLAAITAAIAGERRPRPPEPSDIPGRAYLVRSALRIPGAVAGLVAFSLGTALLAVSVVIALRASN